MWSCSRRGFPSTPGRPEAWWALTPPFHPCPCGRSSFLWHCPWGRPLSRFGTALPCGARTFLPLFPGSNHLTRSDSLTVVRTQQSGVRREAAFLSFLLPTGSCLLTPYIIFSSIALFASASASLFCSLGMYCTLTLLIFAINSLALPYNGFRPSFFTL